MKFFPFIRTAILNLFSKPATVNYPAEPAAYPKGMRGHIVIEEEKCILCGICARSCPPRAIHVDRAQSIWEIQRFDCVQCGNCVNLCPKKCLQLDTQYYAPGIHKTTDTVQVPKKQA